MNFLTDNQPSAEISHQSSGLQDYGTIASANRSDTEIMMYENPNSINGKANRKASQNNKNKSLRAYTDNANGEYGNNIEENSGDFFLEGGRLIRRHGINWLVASLFIVADMAGGGIVALPTAMVRCSLILGIGLLLLMAVLATSSSILLGKTWMILLRLYPIYRTHCRKPFAEMGYRALGLPMKSIVSVCLNVTQFGASTVFLILIAKNTDDFMRAIFRTDIGICLMIVIVAIIIFPITLPKSPQDFWPVVVLGMITTSTAVLFVCIGAMLDAPLCAKERGTSELTASNVLLALGTIMFSYGGHSALPTIQHDMRHPAEFDKSSVLAFFLITIMNLFAVLFGVLIYGDALGDSVINSIQTVWIQQAINLMILAHCILTFTLIINPLYQEIEECFNVPQGFTIRRVMVRIGMMGFVIFVAASVPTFEAIISVIGAIAFMLISITFPCLFYLYLSAIEKRRRERKNAIFTQNGTKMLANGNGIGSRINTINNEFERITFNEVMQRTEPEIVFLCGTIFCLGSISAVVATVTSLGAIVITKFKAPCYARPFISGFNDTVAPNVTHCCTQWLNVSMPDTFCTPRNPNFYNVSLF